jgi:hypothetical protein
MGRHEAQPQRRATVTKVASAAGLAAAAATAAMTVGAGSAQADPITDTINRISSIGGSTAASGPDIGGFLSSIAPSVYNPGPFTIGPVTSPKFPSGCTVNGTNVCSNFAGVFVKPPQPGSTPFVSIQGIQIPIWTVRGGTPVPPA